MSLVCSKRIFICLNGGIPSILFHSCPPPIFKQDMMYMQSSVQILGIRLDEFYIYRLHSSHVLYPCNRSSDQNIRHLKKPLFPFQAIASWCVFGSLLLNLYSLEIGVPNSLSIWHFLCPQIFLAWCGWKQALGVTGIFCRTFCCHGALSLWEGSFPCPVGPCSSGDSEAFQAASRV